MIKPNLLVIDDDQFVVDMITSILSEQFNISAVTSGSEGLDFIQTQKPDLVILDVVMPGIDGFKVLETIKSSPKTSDIPVIVLSVLDGNEEIKYAASLGAMDYLIKPSSVAEIKAAAKKAFTA